jgi:hypothetical protein
LTLLWGFSSLQCAPMNEDRKPRDEATAGKTSRPGMSRREFARRAALASAIASWAPVRSATAASTNGATEAAAPRATPASSAPQDTRSPAPVVTQQAAALPKLSAESQAEVEARVQAIFSQYGARLSDEQKTDVRRLCTLAQPPLDRLRAYHLENADGPALYLKPLVEREKKPTAPKPATKNPLGPAPTAPQKKP